jgi:hypothetical protein
MRQVWAERHISAMILTGLTLSLFEIAFVNDAFVRFAFALDAVLPVAALIWHHPDNFEVANR